MKAYQVWDTMSVENCSTVVFAENGKEAKKIARSTEVCEDADYINIRVKRFPEMDKHYRGHVEVDWYDMEDRQALVRLGWMCLDTGEECDTWPVREFCGHWEGEDEEE